MRAITGFCLLLAMIIFHAGCSRESAETSQGVYADRPADKLGPTESAINRTTVSEELILRLTPKFGTMTRHLTGSDSNLGQLFANEIHYSGPAELDLHAEISAHSPGIDGMPIQFELPNLKRSPANTVSAGQVWSAITKTIKFTDAQFGVASGEFFEDGSLFRMETIFEGRFAYDQGGVGGVRAKQTLDWRPAGKNNDIRDWKICAWRQHGFQVSYSPQALFADVTKEGITDKDTLETLTHSIHQDLMLERTTDSTWNRKRVSKIFRYFSDWESSFQYPSVSVVDFNQDQWDDLFVLDRWGSSLLLKNNGNGTFSDVTEATGLKLDQSFANCAVFVDFDNDGDADVLIGRSVEPCLFFRNEGGKFMPDEEINSELESIKFVTTASAADVNRDGLTDIYLSTYCFTSADPLNWVREAVPLDDQLPLRLKLMRAHNYLERGGPPNVLLMNRGGKLEKVEISNSLKQWKNSYQSVWLDVDDDGDQDLYVCNDFSPDVFLRNDTPRGSFEVKFQDVTAELIPGGSMCFGMGASVGDYNADGELDLYVSNMYSKAGKRIIGSIGGEVDPRIKIASQGNFLYRNEGGKFKQVAGTGEGDQLVAKVGWSFGGQFADFNNDGRLDLYVPSGFFTVPENIDSQVDL